MHITPKYIYLPELRFDPQRHKQLLRNAGI